MKRILNLHQYKAVVFTIKPRISPEAVGYNTIDVLIKTVSLSISTEMYGRYYFVEDDYIEMLITTVPAVQFYAYLPRRKSQCIHLLLGKWFDNLR